MNGKTSVRSRGVYKEILKCDKYQPVRIVIEAKMASRDWFRCSNVVLLQHVLVTITLFMTLLFYNVLE